MCTHGLASDVSCESTIYAKSGVIVVAIAMYVHVWLCMEFIAATKCILLIAGMRMHMYGIHVSKMDIARCPDNFI